jgi:hypothetical protein
LPEFKIEQSTPGIAATYMGRTADRNIPSFVTDFRVLPIE